MAFGGRRRRTQEQLEAVRALEWNRVQCIICVLFQRSKLLLGQEKLNQVRQWLIQDDIVWLLYSLALHFSRSSYDMALFSALNMFLMKRRMNTSIITRNPDIGAFYETHARWQYPMARTLGKDKETSIKSMGATRRSNSSAQTLDLLPLGNGFGLLTAILGKNPAEAPLPGAVSHLSISDILLSNLFINNLSFLNTRTMFASKAGLYGCTLPYNRN